MVNCCLLTPFPASTSADHAPKIPLIPVVAGLAAVAAPAIVTAPILAVLGFGAAGPVAGSAAAIAQGVIGNVVAGSPFAIAQSAAMGGYGAAIVNGVVQGGGLLLTGISSAECLMSGCGRDEI
ncbi:uncharacterized protein B0T23DRAFT_398630 [Neurospora hispaniola]|uniref:Uncharacterized protein n=1 Tax=Neurospora hispaniola TaxID=588809 RepID=A0AAJ0MNN3_9PEZI|nr:hypothetical protein B0T23DRAFT_398630 [Neurospora hispaniola]